MKRNVPSTFQLFYLSFTLLFCLSEAQATVFPPTVCAKSDLFPWQFFTTPNGTLGGPALPDCTAFDTNGDRKATRSIRFKVGQRHYEKDGIVLQGGGLRVSQWMPSGEIILSMDMASHYSSPKDRRNLAGGLFEFVIDGKVIAHYDIGPVDTGTTKRAMLHGTATVSAGRHEIRIQIRRPFQSLPNDHAPYQYLGMITLTLPTR